MGENIDVDGLIATGVTLTAANPEFNGDAIVNLAGRGGVFTVRTTELGAGESCYFVVQYFDSTSSIWNNITTQVIDAVGIKTISIYPGMPSGQPAGNPGVSLNQALPRRIRCRLVRRLADATVTATVGVSVIV